MSRDPYSLQMRHALALAGRARGMTRPNPLVGAVVVRDGAVLGTGWHQRLGGPHAEVNALDEAGESARGATLYVTLEPCTHHGRTPPCTDAIIAAGISEVVIATRDPNPRARGGADVLRDAGIRVIEDVERAAARRLNADFFHAHEQRSPFVTLKLAQSLDGAIAERPGTRSRLTGADANGEVHRLRAQHDAILVGIETVLADDPLLTVRDVPCIAPPLRIVLDTDARLPLDSQLVRTLEQAPACVACASDVPSERVQALEQAGVRVLPLPRTPHGIDIGALLRALFEMDVRSIFVDGGARVAESFLREKLVQRMHVFVAPVALGRDAVRAFS
ncbi:MAG TPA: bifunctional diaminohydroxyphosphoribosylaminopyrimidine deaminase/5-amino-6-(5-phosphoribosylamino)uracil reductase RibD, partial [Longimicrobiales bacterium]|nr:bifunctional diaminohydroxyphosphoribosylaminopyrimidine deaminase/5-amino-6-(5-phosphoribosylamino)uracil reductase RibD [Longimicrobiales bacterium]